MPNPATTANPMLRYGKTRRDHLFFANALVGDIHDVYPERDVPHPYVPTRTAVLDLLKQGVEPLDLIRAARNYAAYCAKEVYRDGIWQQFNLVTVHGRTRDEWARSGQDVSEFDRLAGA